ncbi:hypothetical protein BC937DRAFT_87947 [Endogone sp. FLAS-F59071]|nr:hypothetical protein BC937DRAFT_87947 [Endogone sp. FLAS-F59071]|eukprot:RUS22669.1 hypothetical protein BC937DRAFT_87947 [Endogone sp. FLAS-F59071]
MPTTRKGKGKATSSSKKPVKAKRTRRTMSEQARNKVDRDEVDIDDRVIDDVEIDNDTPLVQVTLNCFLHGDVGGRPFSVKIHKGETIDYLKDAIWRKIMLSTVLPKDLDLWKVQIRCSHQDDKFTALNDPSVDIQNTLEGEQMEEVYYVGDYFNEPPEKYIHVIVRPKLSPPTKKRPEYPEETDEEPLLSPSAKKTRPEYPEETDEGPDSLMVLSEERIKIAVDYMNNHSAGLLRSPPYTGKSSFGMKLCDHFLNLNEDAIYISFAELAGKKECYDEDLFNAYWEEETARTWRDIFKCKTPTKIIIDEVQTIYGDCAPFFWGSIKAHLSKPKNNHRVLLLATYNLALMPGSTPIVFQDPLGLDALRLTETEFEELVKKYVQKKQAQHRSSQFEIPEEVRKAIYNSTRGHAGICRSTLTSLRHMFADGAVAKKMLQYLVSSTFLLDLLGTRALNWVRKWEPTREEASFLRSALYKCDSNSSFTASLDDDDFLHDLSKIGIITKSSQQGRYEFVAPIMRIFMSQRLFTAPTNLPKSPLETFDEFLMRSIERMCPSTLRNSFGKGVTGRLLERTWQMECILLWNSK